jgi:hypothetical protein
MTDVAKLRKADAARRKRAAERQREYRARHKFVGSSSLTGKLGALTEEHPLMAGFLIQAINEFAKEVAKADPEAITKATNGFVSGHMWVDCAKRVLAAEL